MTDESENQGAARCGEATHPPYRPTQGARARALATLSKAPSDPELACLPGCTLGLREPQAWRHGSRGVRPAVIAAKGRERRQSDLRPLLRRKSPILQNPREHSEWPRRFAQQ